MKPCEACGTAARYIVRGICAACGHVQGTAISTPGLELGAL